MVNKLTVQTKNLENFVQFYKTKTHPTKRGIQFRNYQKDVEIFTDLVKKLRSNR